MIDTWVVRMVRARCIRRVAAWVLALGSVVLFAMAQHRYITNFLSGPFDLGQAELDSVDDISVAQRYFARVTGSKAVDTGIQEITVHKRGEVETSRSVSGVYYALVVGDRLLLVKGSAGALTTAEGELKVIPAVLDRQLFDSVAMLAIRNRFYRFYLDDASFRLPGYCAVGAALLFGFLLLRYGVPAWRQLQDPSSHPVVRRVASWGDPIGVALDAEREAASPRHKSRGWLMTEKYLIQSSFFTFDLLRITDLVWAYKRVTRHSVNFIPTGKTYEGVFACYGRTAIVKGRQKTVDAMLAFAAERVQWAVFDFSNKLQRLFNKDNRGFCAAVEQRRREWEQQAGVRRNS
ncbi:MAG TPA: hypothetical protein VF311_16220 [Terriglobales bacterium]